MGSREIKELLKNSIFCKVARQYVRKDLCKCYIEGEQCQCQLGSLEGEKKTFFLNKEYLERVIAAQEKYAPKNEQEALFNQGIITAYKLLVQVIDEGVLICNEGCNHYNKQEDGYFNCWYCHDCNEYIEFDKEEEQ